ncbi:two component transcriptional regulator, winged helix family [Desulfovibrio sp. X2]|uniref:response regulator n=1 Tax=Desulfovibrio sp. X2 TaxID=941449 RepID=UPI0003587267|nr:response regulator transcription factor [Desulfovibrio sp. X2]EPR43090.1 two component transcriptional regulator, winged helix family [Desulfovibrio sp. X2]
MRILLVEDDAMFGQSLSQALKDAGHSVDWARDGAQAEAALAGEGYVLVLLDLGLPGRSGLDVLRGMRGRDDRVPVLILTARDGVEDRVSGLDLGADDYLVKPFDFKELQARMRALIRRRSGHADSVLGNGDIELDLATHEARRGGAPVRLSAREFALLYALLEHPGAVLSRGQLEERVYGWNEEVESNAVEVLIHYLRKKLGHDAVRNIRGVGWMVAEGR